MKCNQNCLRDARFRVQIQKDLRFEAWKPFFFQRDMGVYVINIYREICKPVLKLVFLRRIAQWSPSQNLNSEVRLMLFWKLN